jgi:hypothetical protein
MAALAPKWPRPGSGHQAMIRTSSSTLASAMAGAATAHGIEALSLL